MTRFRSKILKLNYFCALNEHFALKFTYFHTKQHNIEPQVPFSTF